MSDGALALAGVVSCLLLVIVSEWGIVALHLWLRRRLRESYRRSVQRIKAHERAQRVR